MWRGGGVTAEDGRVAYDEELADRIRGRLAGDPDVTEQRMFGGLAFLVHGNMAVAASGQGGLMVRVDPGSSSAFLDEPGVAPMEMRGRSMKGWLRVDTSAVATAEALSRWVNEGVAYARTLPRK